MSSQFCWFEAITLLRAARGCIGGPTWWRRDAPRVGNHVEHKLTCMYQLRTAKLRFHSAADDVQQARRSCSRLPTVCQRAVLLTRLRHSATCPIASPRHVIELQAV